jgi:hypothetical protein
MTTDTTTKPELPQASHFDESKNPTLEQVPEGNTPVQEWLLDYVGNKLKPEDGKITVSMIVDVLADEFPDFVLALAEENWLRGYRQGLVDVEEGRLAIQQEVDNHSKDIISK